jgi:CelD/BcsL family acetyltransferase involved in cellulose biosynthesis
VRLPDVPRPAITCVPVSRLSPRDLASWIDIHEAPGRLNSPFLHPTYVSAVGRVGHDVRVGVIHGSEEAVGFVPYQLAWPRVGRSVGSRLCDLSGALVRDGVRWDVEALTRAAGLCALQLSNVPTSQEELEPFQRSGRPAPIIDLSSGYEAYRAHQRRDSNLITNVERLKRKAQREVGPVRFVWHTEDSRVRDALLAWKGEQRRATRTPDILAFGWSRELVGRILEAQGPGFAGVLSALYIGETLAAAHLGMRSGEVLHYWVPAFNRALASYSPGLLLLQCLIRAADERGVRRLDLGPGDEAYKQRMSTGEWEVGDVVVARAGIAGALGALYGARSRLRGSRTGRVLRNGARAALRTAYAIGSAMERPASRSSSGAPPGPSHPPGGSPAAHEPDARAPART